MALPTALSFLTAYVWPPLSLSRARYISFYGAHVRELNFSLETNTMTAKFLVEYMYLNMIRNPKIGLINTRKNKFKQRTVYYVPYSPNKHISCEIVYNLRMAANFNTRVKLK